MYDGVLEPGTIVSPAVAKPIIGKFRDIYRAPRQDKMKGGPTWLRLPKFISVDISIFRHDEVLSHKSLFVLYEYQRRLREATPADIQGYVNDGARRFYVLDKALRWCIACTGELNDSSDVILLSGDVSAFGMKYR